MSERDTENLITVDLQMIKWINVTEKTDMENNYECNKIFTNKISVLNNQTS